MEIEMKIRGLMMDPMTNLPVVILKEACGNGILPIWVGVHDDNRRVPRVRTVLDLIAEAVHSRADMLSPPD